MNSEAILDFWFGPTKDDPAEAMGRYSFWFNADPETDESIQSKFSVEVERAKAGVLPDWESRAQSWVALIVVLDQFPRNLYRGTRSAFELDPVAQKIAESGFARHLDAGLGVSEYLFCLMPFQHAEDINLQREAVDRGEALRGQAPHEWRAVIETFQGSAKKHLSIIQEFGRFPHRNKILGRTSTKAETIFLSRGTGSFGQTPRV